MSKVETIKSALKFLVQKQIEQTSYGYADDNDNIVSWKEVLEWLEQQSSEDCIGREAAIRIAEQGQIEGYEWQFKKLCNLSSVTPQRPKGKWILCHPLQADDPGAYRCSVCGYGDWGLDPNVDKYCFNCGAKMEDAQSNKEDVENV